MALYNWQRPDWPHFIFSVDRIEDDLLTFSEKTGRVSGILEGLPDERNRMLLLMSYLQKRSKLLK